MRETNKTWCQFLKSNIHLNLLSMLRCAYTIELYHHIP